MSMHGQLASRPFSAARAAATLFGVLAGLGGLTHGVGEMIQGNIAPSGLVFNSWVQGPIAAYMGGEPALTLVPNLLLAGGLTILVSVAVIVWAVGGVQRPGGGAVLMALALGLLLSGGGFGPPIIGLLAGVNGTGIHAPAGGWGARLPRGVRRALARAWPWVFGAGALNGTFLVVGSVGLVYLFGFNHADLFVGSLFLSIGLLLLTYFTGMAYDHQAAAQRAV